MPNLRMKGVMCAIKPTIGRNEYSFGQYGTKPRQLTCGELGSSRTLVIVVSCVLPIFQKPLHMDFEIVGLFAEQEISLLASSTPREKGP